MTKQTKTFAARAAIIILTLATFTSCADPAFQQYLTNRQAAISSMPNGPQKAYEQARLDEQILADKQAEQQRWAAAGAYMAAGMANAGATYARTVHFDPPITQVPQGTLLNPIYIKASPYGF
jgi:hypothetical protein